MKGFAITLDAVAALAFFMLAMVIISAQAYHPKTPGGIYLKQLTLDTMTVLEKTGRVERALDGNTSAMDDVIGALPVLACTRLSIINSSQDVVLSAEKANCSETAGLDMQTAARPLLYRGTMYVMKSESWFRKEPD